MHIYRTRSTGEEKIRPVCSRQDLFAACLGAKLARPTLQHGSASYKIMQTLFPVWPLIVLRNFAQEKHLLKKVSGLTRWTTAECCRSLLAGGILILAFLGFRSSRKTHAILPRGFPIPSTFLILYESNSKFSKSIPPVILWIPSSLQFLRVT